MNTRLNSYLSFRGETREAMEFYKSVFGGELTMNTFQDFQQSQDPSLDNLIMHAMLEADNGIFFMAADTPESMDYQHGTNVSMSISGDNEAELRSYSEKLSKCGMITLPLEKTPLETLLACCQTNLA